MSTQTTEREAQAPAEDAAKSPAGPRRRHRTTRHVVTHGSAATGVTGAAAAAHVFGLAGIGVAAGGAVVLAGGAYVARRAAKSRKSAAKARPATRVRRRTTTTTTGRRTAAGLRRDPATPRASNGRAGATVRPRRKGATGAGATPRRSAGLRRAQAADKTRTTKGGRRTATTKRRPRPASTAPSGRGRRGSAPRAARPAAASRPGAATKAARTATKRSATRRAAVTVRPEARQGAAAKRPTPRHATPSRPTNAALVARQRRAARIAKRRLIKSGKFVAGGAVASRPFLRLWPTTAERAMAAKTKAAAAKKAPTKSAPANAEKKTAKPTAKKTAPGKPVQRPTSRPAARPGAAITAPGLEREKVSDLNTPNGSIIAATDAVNEHIAAWEPENATDIFGFFAGIEGFFSHLGMAFTNVADRLGSDYPIDQRVVDHLNEMAAMAVNLGAWGAQTHQLARAAHETELHRLEQPRPREEVFDVDHNR